MAGTRATKKRRQRTGKQNTRDITYVNADGNRGPAVDEHLVVAVDETREPGVHCLLAVDATAIGMLLEKHDGGLEVDLLDVAAPIALRVGAVDLLLDEQIGVREPRSNVENGVGRMRGSTADEVGVHRWGNRGARHHGRVEVGGFARRREVRALHRVG